MKKFKQFIEEKDPRIGSPDPLTPIQFILNRMKKRYQGIQDAEGDFKRLSDKGKV